MNSFFTDRAVLIALIGVLVFSGFPPQVYAQEQSGPDVRYDPTKPVPYDEDEFPPWARALRRGEVIAVGAFPLAMIVSSLGYEIGRFAYHSVQSGEIDSRYAPWFFSTAPEGAFTNRERIGLVLSASLLSVGVAVTDFILGKIDAEGAERETEKRNGRFSDE